MGCMQISLASILPALKQHHCGQTRAKWSAAHQPSLHAVHAASTDTVAIAVGCTQSLHGPVLTSGQAQTCLAWLPVHAAQLLVMEDVEACKTHVCCTQRGWGPVPMLTCTTHAVAEGALP